MCQNCSTRFFDLNKTPVTCPKCGEIFQSAPLSRSAQRATLANEEEEDEVEIPGGAELVSLDDADTAEEKIVVTVDEDVEIDSPDETFLEEEDDDDDDVADLIDGDLEDDDER